MIQKKKIKTRYIDQNKNNLQNTYKLVEKKIGNEKKFIEKYLNNNKCISNIKQEETIEEKNQKNSKDINEKKQI